MDDRPDPGPHDLDEEGRLGALEGTGFGLLVAGAIMGMSWLGAQFGSVLPIEEGRYALMFGGGGIAILVYAMYRREA